MLQATLGGRVLFTRSQTGLMPTAAAHELRPHAEDMAAAAAAFVRMGSGNLEETAGVVRLAAADVVGVEVLPPILSDFRYQYPNTVIELSVSNQMADLLRRDADIAVRMVRPKQKALLAKRAGTDRARISCASPLPGALRVSGTVGRLGPPHADRIRSRRALRPIFSRRCPYPCRASFSHSVATTTWRYWPRCVPDLVLAFATPESPAAIRTSCRCSASNSRSSWKSGSSCTMN